MSDDADEVQQELPKITVSLQQAASCILKVIKAKRVGMLHGSPGIGKSAIVGNFIATKYNLFLIDVRLAQNEPQDMLGFPAIDQVRQKAGYIPMDTFPLEGDEIPVNPATGKPYDGFLLFLDELTSADDDVQAAAYKVVLDRKVGNKSIHPRCVILAAGNLESDNAIVKPMSTALQSRMVHFLVVADFKEWLSWAMDRKFDFRITAYIQYRPANLYNFDPDHSDLTYACHRTWEFADDILKVINGDTSDPDFLPLIAGCVSEGVAREFQMFCDIFDQLPKMSDIIMAPAMVPMPSEPSILFALASSIGNQMDITNADKLLAFVKRMALEFQVVTLRYVMKRQAVPLKHPAIADWITKHGTELF